MDKAYRIPVSFETERYYLRRVTVEDAPAVFDSYAQDAAVTRFLGWRPHTQLGETMSFLRDATQEWEVGRGFPLAAFALSEPDDLIGMFHPHVTASTVNYGYVLAQRAWGSGCATEVMSWLVDHALAHPSIFRAEAFCDVENHASARVMEKVGMVCEGVLRRYFRHPNISEEPRDCMMYARI